MLTQESTQVLLKRSLGEIQLVQKSAFPWQESQPTAALQSEQILFSVSAKVFATQAEASTHYVVPF